MRTFTREKTLNNVRVIGTVESIDRRDGESKAGVPVVMGSIMVKHEESVVRVDYYELKTWKNGTMKNEKYNTISNMEEGNLVSLACSLEGNKFVGRDGNLVNGQRLNLNFINDVRATDSYGTVFDIIGVVLDPIREVKDKDNNIINYTLKIGQAPQYQPANGPLRGYSMVTLDVDPKNTPIVNGIEKNYLAGTTVRVSGHAQATVTEHVEVIESIFGDDEKRVTQRFDSKFYIDKGLRVLPDQEYTEEDIAYLTQATLDENTRLEEDAKSKPAATADTATSGAAEGSLENLLGF